MPIQSTYKQNLEALKKVPDFYGCQDCDIFSDIQNPTSKCLELACKVKISFRPGVIQILAEPAGKNLIHFACQFEAHKSGILQS
jgi:hypothetical protein